MNTTIDEIRAALNERRGTWRQICKDTGLGYWWLTKFAQGHIRSPGYDKVQTLAVYLFTPEEVA